MTRTLTALAVGALALTACSGGGTASGETGADGAETVPGGLPLTATAQFDVEADEAAAALLPDDVLDRGAIRIAMGVPYPPFVEYNDADELVGVDVDMALALGQTLGIDVEVNHQPFESVIPSLQSDRHDLIMMGMNDSKERQQTLNFIEEIKAGFAIVVAKGNPEGINTLTDLCGHSASTQKSTLQAELLQQLSEECIADGKEGIDVQALPVAQDSQTALRAGRAQAYIVDAPVAAFTAATAGDGEHFELVEDPQNPQGFNPVYSGFGLLKERTELTDALQAAMQSLMDQGVYQRILEEHGLGSLALDEALVNAADE
ncbi:ABC transporter substrate-binding protein [Leucobacter sp. UCD-THU]|jgi:polar amino acid transport system substrate-binding protein|uniref:ABC transporter substrate-binding protein n=2 Tax=Microbacteriaceae TaxID=85023 RepID=A0ABX5QJ56_9MICO|nr:ABC transporter substrate-binding protein [Leucobacter sp. UCD-THU]QAB19068.1 ABC transporter substrate-binding protein [Leucobacter muris]